MGIGGNPDPGFSTKKKKKKTRAGVGPKRRRWGGNPSSSRKDRNEREGRASESVRNGQTGLNSFELKVKLVKSTSKGKKMERTEQI